MNSGRRGFFTKLIGAAAGTAVVAKAEPPVLPFSLKQKLTVNRQEWDIYWTGWKQSPDTEMLAAQWVAKTGPREGAFRNGFHGVVATIGGSVGEFHLGDMFWIGYKDGYSYITKSSTDVEKDASRKRAFDNLIDFIKTSPLADRSRCYRCGAKREDDPRHAPKDIVFVSPKELKFRYDDVASAEDREEIGKVFRQFFVAKE